MSEMHVDLGVLATVATSLDTAADGLEGIAGDAPAAVDAGPMTAVITAMLAQVTNSAGNVSIGLSGAADLVRTCRTYYRRADADAEAGLDDIRKVVDP